MSLEDFPGFDQVVRVRLAAAVDKLASEFEGVHDREHLSATVDESSQRLLQSGSVTAFVHTLAERGHERRADHQGLQRPDRRAEEVITIAAAA